MSAMESVGIDINQISSEQFDEIGESILTSAEYQDQAFGNDVATSNRYHQLENEKRQLKIDNEKNVTELSRKYEKEKEELNDYYVRLIRQYEDKIDELNEYIRGNCR